MNMNLKQISIIFLLALMIFGVAARFLSLNKEFSAEEVDFIGAGKAIVHTGHPIYYESEQFTKMLALWHPPMYIYSLALTFKFLGEGEIQARSVNIIFSILAAMIIFLFCKDLLEKNGKIVGLISSALFLTNYYVLSSSLVIDIDMFSAFFLICFLYFLLMNHKTDKMHFLILSGISLLLGFWNRYPLATLEYICIGAYYFFNTEFRKELKNYALMGIFAATAFILTWGAYSTFIEPGTFMNFIAHNANLGEEQLTNLGVYAGSFMLNISQITRLFTLPAMILIAWSFIHFIRKRERIIDFLLVYSGVILLLFLAIPRPAFGYPRYFLSAFPALMIIVGYFLYENLKGCKFSKKEIILGILSFGTSVLLLVLLKPQLTAYISSGLIKATNLPDFVFNLFGSVPLIFTCFLKKGNRMKGALIILVALLMSYSLYFDVGLVKNDSNIKEVGHYLKEHVKEGGRVIAPKAIGYYYGRIFYANDFYKPSLKRLSITYLMDYIKMSCRYRMMENEFFWGDDIYAGAYFSSYTKPDEGLMSSSYIVLSYALNDAEYEKNIGEFYIYRLKTQ